MLTARELQTLRNEANLYEDAADEIETLRWLLRRLRGVVFRYRTETPFGNQPHMIAHVADEAIAAADAALKDAP
jgi:hypothetical protein